MFALQGCEDCRCVNVVAFFAQSTPLTRVRCASSQNSSSGGVWICRVLLTIRAPRLLVLLDRLMPNVETDVKTNDSFQHRCLFSPNTNKWLSPYPKTAIGFALNVSVPCKTNVMTTSTTPKHTKPWGQPRMSSTLRN